MEDKPVFLLLTKPTMQNYAWTHDYLTLTLLPCGTIHLEIQEDDGSITFDKVDTINVVDEALILNCPQMVYEFPFGTNFIEETNEAFPIADFVPPSKMNIIKGNWDENGNPIEILYIQDNQLKLIQTTPTGDRLDVVLA